MISKTGLCAVLAGAVSSAMTSAHAAAMTDMPAWFIGRWILAEDEDGGRPGMDLDEFRADGHYVIYGPGCKESLVATYHVHGGDIYVTSEVPGKGPIAMIFRPGANHETLVYTSPRTRHNAVYRRSPPLICPGK